MDSKENCIETPSKKTKSDEISSKLPQARSLNHTRNEANFDNFHEEGESSISQDVNHEDTNINCEKGDFLEAKDLKSNT